MAISDDKCLSLLHGKIKLQNLNVYLKLIHKFKIFHAASARVFIKANVLVHLLEVGQRGFFFGPCIFNN